MPTAAELLAIDFGPLLASELVELVDEQLCTPACLFATGASECDCVCGWKYHGYARETR